MHIMIVTASLESGGAERVIAQLINGWSNSKIKCSLILLKKTERFYTIYEGVKLYEIGQLDSIAYIDKIKKYKKVREIVKNSKPDIVLSLPEEIGIYVIGALLGVKVPVVVSERNNPWVMPYRKPTRLLRRIMYPLADGYIFQTEQASRFFSKRIQKKGIVLPNPLEIDRLPEPYSGKRKKLIVGVGRLERQKNFKLLIDAFSLFYNSHNEYKLVIFGEGSLRSELEKYAEEKLIAESWSLPGKYQDILERINDAACFVLSSDYEGVPNALIEAMAIGVPCVSTNCKPGGAATIITNGFNGFLVPIGDSKTMSEKISKIVDSKEISEMFSKEATKIRDKLECNRVCCMWEKYLRKVIENK